MPQNGFRVLDSDLHVFEPSGMYQHYLHPKYCHRAPTTEPSKHGGYRPSSWRVGDDILVFSTDYPHSDSLFPDSTECLLNLELSDATKTKILWDNCTRLYGSRVGSALVS